MALLIGQHIPLLGGPAKVLGKAQYVADLYVPRMLHLKVLRSPHPHARIAAEIVADLVERDRVFYDPVITEEDIGATSDFSRSLGLLSEPVPYDQVVATRFRPLW